MADELDLPPGAVHRRDRGTGRPAAVPAAVPTGPTGRDREGREAAGGGAGQLPRPGSCGSSDAPRRSPTTSTWRRPRTPTGSVGTIGVSYDEDLNRIMVVPKSWWPRTRRRRGSLHGHARAGRRLRHAGHRAWSRPGVQPARCAGCRSTPRATLPENQRPPAAGDLRRPWRKPDRHRAGRPKVHRRT